MQLVCNMDCVRFTKMQSAGNDYIYIDAVTTDSPCNIERIVKPICDRHFGVGADGVVLITTSEVADFKMIMYNADGSRGKMCGNASICIAKFVHDKRLSTNDTIQLETDAGIRTLFLGLISDEIVAVTVDMGEPEFAPNKIPVSIKADSVIDYPVATSSGHLNITALSMGNPHGVVFVDDLMTVDVCRSGEELEHSPLFPDGANIEFVEIMNPGEFRMRVWERGSGETLACGTGVCASLVAGVIIGKCSRQATAHLPGGDLQVRWDDDSNHVYLSGLGITVFEGEYYL